MREDWIEVSIDELISKNGIFCDGDWVESKDQDPNGDIRLIQLADIGDGYFINKSHRFLTFQKAKDLKCTFLKEGDLILARMPEPLGRVTIFPLKGDYKYVTVVDIAIIRPENQYVNNKYLLYSINSPFIRKEIDALQSGTTRKRISRKNLAKIIFSIPPLPVQRTIVQKIENLFASLDKGIADLKTTQEQLKVYRQAVLKKAFEGKPLCKLDTFILNSQNGLSKRSGKEGKATKVLRLADINNLEISDLSPRSIIMTESELLKYKLLEDELLIIRVNGSIDLVGRFIHVSKEDENQVWAYCDHFIKIQLNKEKCFSKYYFYYLQFPSVRKFINENMVSSAGQNTVSQTTIKAIEVPITNINEQHAIVREIESHFSVCDKVEQSITEALEKAEALRQSILKKAFEGKLLSEAEIVKCKQEADYEPASELLKKIKAGNKQ